MAECVQQAFNDIGDPTPTVLAMTFASALWNSSVTCGSSCAWNDHMMCSVARFLDHTAPVVFHSDPLKARDFLQTSIKRRRIGEDFKQCVCHKETTAWTWVGPHVCHYRCATILSFQRSRCISVTHDAKRLGKPKEETLIIGVSDCKTLRSGWAPPQVVWVRAFWTLLLRSRLSHKVATRNKWGLECCHRVVLIRFFLREEHVVCRVSVQVTNKMSARDTFCISNSLLVIHFVFSILCW